MRCGEGIQAGMEAADNGDLVCVYGRAAVAGRGGGRLAGSRAGWLLGRPAAGVPGPGAGAGGGLGWGV